MSYIDKTTFEIYHDTEDIRISGEVFECDELIAPAISLLNKKGYITEFCCSGHILDSMYESLESSILSVEYPGFIVFDKKVKTIPDTPDLFEVINNPQGFIEIQWNFSSKTHIKRLAEMSDAAIRLFEWADSLPEYRGA